MVQARIVSWNSAAYGQRDSIRRMNIAGAGKEPVLRLLCGTDTLFSSDKPWLHPMLDLSEYLAGRTGSPEGCTLYDKIVGRAAALLAVRLGIRAVQADVISRRAIPVFEAHGVTWQGGTVVDRIDCRTEEILADEHDPEAAYRIIRERAAAGRSQVSPDPSS